MCIRDRWYGRLGPTRVLIDSHGIYSDPAWHGIYSDAGMASKRVWHVAKTYIVRHGSTDMTLFLEDRGQLSHS